MSLFKREVSPSLLIPGLAEIIKPYRVDSIIGEHDYPADEMKFMLSRRKVSHKITWSSFDILNENYSPLTEKAKRAANRLAEWPNLLRMQ